MRGLYVHVPFCAAKCGYCAFYSVPAAPPDLRSAYLQRLDAELAAEFARTEIEIIGSVPTDPVIREYELKAQSLLAAPAGSKAAMAVDEIIEKILKRRSA